MLRGLAASLPLLFVGLLIYGVTAQSPNKTIDDALSRGETPAAPSFRLAVLQGGRELLQRARPHVILEHVAEAADLYGVRSADVWDLLGRLGYELFSVTGEGEPLMTFWFR